MDVIKDDNLMLNDWLMRSHDKVPFRINALSENCKWENCEYVPITEEILKNNGFKDSQFYGELITENWQIQCDCINIKGLSKDGMTFDLKIKYVHELQHVLRICGLSELANNLNIVSPIH